MPETSCDPRTTLATLPVEIQLKIFRYVMASDAPVDLQEFVELGRELQSSREARSESYTEGESVALEEQRLSTQESQSFTTWAPHHIFFTELHPSQKKHYLDWLLVNSTCRRFRELGKVAFFSEKCFILRPFFLSVLSHGRAKNLSVADTATALTQIRHVIAPLAFDCNARDFRTLSRCHALSCMKVLSIQHRTYEAIIRSLGRPAVVDLAAVDRILPPQELLDFLPDLGLRVDQVHVDLIVDGDKDIVEHLTSEVYPGLRKSAAQEARRWRS